jgi:hypothetical protein
VDRDHRHFKRRILLARFCEALLAAFPWYVPSRFSFKRPISNVLRAVSDIECGFVMASCNAARVGQVCCFGV